MNQMWLINNYDLFSFFDRKDFIMTENDILLTDRESAKLLHMSVSTFRRHVTNGSLPKPLKFGFLSRWLQSDLINVIEKAKQQRQSDAA